VFVSNYSDLCYNYSVQYEESSNNCIILSSRVKSRIQIGTNLDENENNQVSLDVGTAQNNTESIDSEIVGDPGLRKPIEELDVNIRDVRAPRGGVNR
jgi:hypothetical protein